MESKKTKKARNKVQKERLGGKTMRTRKDEMEKETKKNKKKNKKKQNNNKNNNKKTKKKEKKKKRREKKKKEEKKKKKKKADNQAVFMFSNLPACSYWSFHFDRVSWSS